MFESGDFALIGSERVEIVEQTYTSADPAFPYTSSVEVPRSIERIYFLGQEDYPESFAQAERSRIETKAARRGLFVRKKLLKKYFGDKYDTVRDYAQKEGLRFHEKEELVEVVRYYSTLP